MMRESKPMDPQLRAFLDSAATPGPIQSADDARGRMERALASRETIAGLPNDVVTRDIAVGQPGTPALAARLYTPGDATGPLPLLVYLHGGGWVAGSIATHDPFCRLLCAASGVQLISLEYSRAPEAPFPAAFHEVVRAIGWVSDHAAEFGADPRQLAIGGDSAGANLAAAAANWLNARMGTVKLRAQLLLFPVTDAPGSDHASWQERAMGCGLDAAGMRWYWSQYAPAVPVHDAEAYPLNGILPGLPPTYVATAEYDVLRDEGIAYANKLRAAGVHVTHVHAPDMHHNFFVGPGTVARFPQCDAALEQAAAWLRMRLGRG